MFFTNSLIRASRSNAFRFGSQRAHSCFTVVGAPALIAHHHPTFPQNPCGIYKGSAGSRSNTFSYSTMSLPTTFTLNNGIKLPSVIYGSYKSTGDEGVDAMVYAIDEAGYTGIDTALKYGNHDEVKQALQKMKTPREKIILQTKIWPTEMREPEKWVDQSIKELGTYIDVFIIHWPFPQTEDGKVDEGWDFVKTWKILEKIPKDKVRSIGVSNFRIEDLEKLLKETDVVPVLNQCEFHPELPQDELVEFCLKHKILPQAYRPLARGQLSDPIIGEVAKKHGVDPGQVALSWNVQRGVCVLPKSVTKSRIVSNNQLIKLDDEDMQKLTELGKRENRTCGSEGIYGFDYFN